MSLGAALLGLAVAVLTVGDDPVPTTSWAFVGLGGFYFAVLALLGLWGYSLRDFDHGPPLPEFWAAARGHDERELYWSAAETYTEAYINNQGQMGPKVRAGRFGLWLVTFEFLSLLIALFLAA